MNTSVARPPWTEALGQSADGMAPLADVLVVEIGTCLAVAFCGKLLADYGATVIKVEDPAVPDPLRKTGPFLTATDGQESALGHFLNGRKLSVSLDSTTERGGVLLTELLKGADIITRFGPAPADTTVLGNAHPSVRIELSWFGQNGPWSQFACDDFLAQHVSGMAFATAIRVQDPSTQPPLATAGHFAEMTAGLAAAQAAVAALVGWDVDGGSEVIDLSIAEAVTSFMRQEIVTYSYGAGNMSRSYLARSPIAAPVFQQPTAEGYVDLMILQEAPWDSLVELLGSPDWAKNPLFANHPLRSQYWDALEPLLQSEFARFTNQELAAEGQLRGIPIAPINTVGEAAEAQQFASRSFFETEASGLRLPGPPSVVGGEPRERVLRGRPGSDNRRVLGDWLGCSEAELEAFAVRDGILD